MSQLDKIISQLELLKRHLSRGQNTQAQAMLALFRGERIHMKSLMRKLEKEFIQAGLELESYNQTNASERLGVTEANLRYMIKKHRIVPGRRFKAGEKRRRVKTRMLRPDR